AAGRAWWPDQFFDRDAQRRRHTGDDVQRGIGTARLEAGPGRARDAGELRCLLLRDVSPFTQPAQVGGEVRARVVVHVGGVAICCNTGNPVGSTTALMQAERDGDVVRRWRHLMTAAYAA